MFSMIMGELHLRAVVAMAPAAAVAPEQPGPCSPAGMVSTAWPNDHIAVQNGKTYSGPCADRRGRACRARRLRQTQSLLELHLVPSHCRTSDKGACPWFVPYPGG